MELPRLREGPSRPSTVPTQPSYDRSVNHRSSFRHVVFSFHGRSHSRFGFLVAAVSDPQNQRPPRVLPGMASVCPRGLALSPPRSSLHSSPRLPKPSTFNFRQTLTSRLPPAVQRVAVAGTSPFAARASSSASGGVADAGTWEALDGVRVFAASTGEPVFLRDLWDQNEGVAVVALLRHFGCVCCWELASVLKDAMPRFESVGVKLIAVGVGTPDRARILAERLPFPLDYLYADPNRKAYDVLGLYYGLGRTFFNPASAKVFSRWDSFKKANENYTISATPEDKSSVLQQGGMFVFRGKQLLYARKDEGTGDHAPLDEIFDVCSKVPVR